MHCQLSLAIGDENSSGKYLCAAMYVGGQTIRFKRRALQSARAGSLVCLFGMLAFAQSTRGQQDPATGKSTTRNAKPKGGIARRRQSHLRGRPRHHKGRCARKPDRISTRMSSETRRSNDAKEESLGRTQKNLSTMLPNRSRSLPVADHAARSVGSDIR